MEWTHKVLKRYDEGLQELMDAQEYSRQAETADCQADREMFITLGKQEVAHAEHFIKSGDMVLESDDETAKTVWRELKIHLTEWRDSLVMKFSNIEKQK